VICMSLQMLDDNDVRLINNGVGYRPILYASSSGFEATRARFSHEVLSKCGHKLAYK